MSVLPPPSQSQLRVAPGASTISGMTSLTVACRKHVGEIIVCRPIISAHAGHHLRQPSASPGQMKLGFSIQSEHKNSCRQSSAEWLRAQTNMQSVHKTITGLSCPMPVQKNKKSLKLDARVLWKWDRASSPGCTASAMSQLQSHMASCRQCAIPTTLICRVTRKQCYNEDHAQVSMTKWGIHPEIHQGKLVRRAELQLQGPKMREYQTPRWYLEHSIWLQTELCCVLSDCLRVRLSHIGLI